MGRPAPATARENGIRPDRRNPFWKMSNRNMSSALSSATAAIPKIVKFVRSELEKDGRNAYGLAEDWTLPRLAEAWRCPDYASDALRIEDGRVTVLAYATSRENCDGCTWSPDKVGELRTAIGAIFHDRWYGEMDRMAAAWGWPLSKVRRLGDVIFGNILLAEARRLPSAWQRTCGAAAARLYHAGVRLFGGAAHSFMRIAFAAAALGCFAGGCAGCAVPPAWEDGGESYDTPSYAYTNLVTGEHWEGRR